MGYTSINKIFNPGNRDDICLAITKMPKQSKYDRYIKTLRPSVNCPIHPVDWLIMFSLQANMVLRDVMELNRKLQLFTVQFYLYYRSMMEMIIL